MKRYLCSVMWAIALVLLYSMDTSSTVSFCFLKLAGFDHCPGCGIGHAIHSTLHFRFEEAIGHHILGIPSTIALLWLIIKPFTTKYTPYEPTTTDVTRHRTG
jgi:hypothetical protein